MLQKSFKQLYMWNSRGFLFHTNHSQLPSAEHFECDMYIAFLSQWEFLIYPVSWFYDFGEPHRGCIKNNLLNFLLYIVKRLLILPKEHRNYNFNWSRTSMCQMAKRHTLKTKVKFMTIVLFRPMRQFSLHRNLLETILLMLWLASDWSLRYWFINCPVDFSQTNNLFSAFSIIGLFFFFNFLIRSRELSSTRICTSFEETAFRPASEPQIVKCGPEITNVDETAMNPLDLLSFLNIHGPCRLAEPPLDSPWISIFWCASSFFMFHHLPE